MNLKIICLLSALINVEQPEMITERNVAVPMRDGVVLRADVFRPTGRGPFPVLVMRTPYGKKGRRFDQFVQADYIVVCQDARGRFQSDGKWESFVRFETHDAEDGYDTIEWAAKLAGSNGKVGTFGSSYNAFLQWRLAALCPPSLVAMSAQTIHHGSRRPSHIVLPWIPTNVDGETNLGLSGVPVFGRVPIDF